MTKARNPAGSQEDPMTASPLPSDSRARLQVDARRAQLIALGTELFGTHSYDELSMDDIARAGGISKGLVYHYFGSKRGYYVACLRAAADMIRAEAERAAAGSPDDALRGGLAAYVDHVDRHAHAFVTLFRGGVGFDPEVGAIIEETRQHFLDRLLAGMDVATHSPKLRTALRGYIGFVEAAVLDWADHRDQDKRALIDLLAQMAYSTVTTALGEAT